VGSKVFSFEKEEEMLQRWRDFVRQVDPDIITGFNIVNFDFPYIIERADFLKVSHFPSFSRVQNTLSKIKPTTFSSSALGTRDSKEINMEGRI
jgi:DNA polymerase delta subunit 1